MPFLRNDKHMVERSMTLPAIIYLLLPRVTDSSKARQEIAWPNLQACDSWFYEAKCRRNFSQSKPSLKKIIVHILFCFFQICDTGRGVSSIFLFCQRFHRDLVSISLYLTYYSNIGSVSSKFASAEKFMTQQL